MKIEVDEKRLIELLAAELELEALNQGGVDNWEWCGASIRDALRRLAAEYQLTGDNVTFINIAKHMIDIGHGLN